MEQRTDEWFSARLGKVTASRIADVMAGGRGVTRANYAAELVCERLTGTPYPRPTTAAMQWGTDQEADARRLYAFFHDAPVEEVGFADHPKIAMSGASPDGLVGDAGLVEFKCPQTANHLRALTEGYIDRKYILQMQWQMACTGREWCDFASFDPRMPAELQLWVRRVEKDAETQEEIEAAVVQFLAEVGESVAKLRTLAPQEVAA